MRNIAPLLFLALFVFFGASCGPSDPTPEPEVLTDLEKAYENLTSSANTAEILGTRTWKLGTVKKEGADVTSDFTGFTLTLGANNDWSTTNGGGVWSASGVYGLSVTTMTISGKTINYTSDGNSLTLNFAISNNVAVGAKTEVLDGTWEFALVK